MRTLNIIQLVCLLIVCAASAGVLLHTKAAIPDESDAIHRVANSYFRIGQEATLLALDIQERKERTIRKKYGYTRDSNGMYTNQEDFEIVSNPIVLIDDPRIFAALRLMHNGSVLGLDTNSWAGFDDGYNTNRPVHIQTVLKE